MREGKINNSLIPKLVVHIATKNGRIKMHDNSVGYKKGIGYPTVEKEEVLAYVSRLLENKGCPEIEIKIRHYRTENDSE